MPADARQKRWRHLLGETGMTIYKDFKALADDLLKPDTAGGFGQQGIVLVQTTTTRDNPWEDPTTTTVTETLQAAAKGVSADIIGQAVGSEIIVATDLVVTAAIPDLVPAVGNTVQIDGKARSILSVEWLPAAGTKAAVRMIVR